MPDGCNCFSCTAQDPATRLRERLRQLYAAIDDEDDETIDELQGDKSLDGLV